jgi:hypothetical protein
MENSWNFMELRLMEFHGISSIDGIWWNSVSTGLHNNLQARQCTPRAFSQVVLTTILYCS